MRVFVTGASGWVGSAVVRELISAGHQVLGLARSDANAASIASAGAEVHRGSLHDLDSLRRGAAQCGGVIHTAFIHDFSKFAENCEIDRRAIETLGETLEGTDRPLIVSSGVARLAPDRVATEDDNVPDPTPSLPRVSEQTAFAFTGRGVRTMAARLAPTVHGDGDHGFVPRLVTLARETGVSAYIGDGQNRWPAVHRFDAARAIRLALEKGSAGSRYHIVAEDGVPFREIAEAIGRGLNLPVVSKTKEEAAAHFGWFTHFAGMDAPTSSTRTRAALGWQPTEPTLSADLGGPGYFRT
ncbi:MAG: SDR family oxidoreductase [Proteobacteria bacterium]|nr:SDR family oxidoreductase [Pseudomonadota bacterium]